jgi:hypothetical protein
MIIVGFSNTPNLLGCVDIFECPKCLNTSNWQLLKIDKFFTLFFIPIIPTGNKYSLVCEFCDHQEILSKKDFINYKLKYEIELAFSDGEITFDEREIKLNEINYLIDHEKEIKRKKALEGIEEWRLLASKKSDEELMVIYFKERYQYNPSMLIAVKAEIDKRKLI